jgi:hypothetical protein
MTVNDFAKKVRSPLKIFLPVPTAKDIDVVRSELVSQINDTMKSLLKLSLNKDNKYCVWKLETTVYYFVLSPGLTKLFQLLSDVLTATDNTDGQSNASPFEKDYSSVPTEQSDTYIMLIPMKTQNRTLTAKTYTLKKENEKITLSELLKRFKAVPYVKASSSSSSTKDAKDAKKVMYEKIYDSMLIVMNEDLRKALSLRHAAMYKAGKQHNSAIDFSDMKPTWSITLINLESIVIY